MSIITRMRKQNAVYWAPASVDGYGDRGFSSPVEIECRWDDTNELFLDDDGNEVMARSTIYPDRVLAMGGMLKEGELDSSMGDDPAEYSDAYEIRSFQKIPNLKNTEVLYIARVV